MWINYTKGNIQFSIANTNFHAVNLVYEQFQRSIPNHAHGNGSYEIHYISDGYGRVSIDGIYYEIIPNTLYVTGPHVEHAQIPYDQNPMCEYCIYLKTEKKRRISSSSSEDETAICTIFENTPCWLGQDSQQVGQIMNQLFQEIQDHKLGSDIQIETLLKQILVKLVRNYEMGYKIKREPIIPNMDKTSVIIEEYFLYQYQSVSLEELADKLSLSIRQTERLLQKYYGKTFLQKKTEARMSAAAILLSYTEQSITSIAENLGYSSVEHFCSAFKNYYHISPREYRKKKI